MGAARERALPKRPAWGFAIGQLCFVSCFRPGLLVRPLLHSCPGSGPLGLSFASHKPFWLRPSGFLQSKSLRGICLGSGPAPVYLGNILLYVEFVPILLMYIYIYVYMYIYIYTTFVNGMLTGRVAPDDPDLARDPGPIKVAQTLAR